eukprot:c10386_g1_i1 orf=22-417(-)
MAKKWTAMERKIRNFQQLCLNAFLVEFERYEDRTKLLEEGPWVEEDIVFYPSAWKQDKSPKEMLSNPLAWVEFPLLPSKFWVFKEKLAKAVGEVIHIPKKPGYVEDHVCRSECKREVGHKSWCYIDASRTC